MKTDFKNAGMGLLVGAGVGVGLMYLFDPNRGRARRDELEGRAKRLCHETGHAVETLAHDIQNRLGGSAAEAKHLVDTEPVDAETLTARVRSRLGRLVRKPHDVTVVADAGRVVLSGEVEACEAGRVLAGIMAVPGVNDVENQLKLRHLETDQLVRGAGAIASVAAGLVTFAGIRAIKRAG